MQRYKRKSRQSPGWRARLVRIYDAIGDHAGHLLVCHLLLLLTLGFAALLAICVRQLQVYVADPHFNLFAHWMHLIVLAVDGLIFVIWLLRWIIRIWQEAL